MEKIFTKVLESIKNGKIVDAFDNLDLIQESFLDERIYKTIILLKGEYSNVKKNELSGVINLEDYQTSINMLNSKIINFITELKNNSKSSSNTSFKIKGPESTKSTIILSGRRGCGKTVLLYSILHFLQKNVEYSISIKKNNLNIENYYNFFSQKNIELWPDATIYPGENVKLLLYNYFNSTIIDLMVKIIMYPEFWDDEEYDEYRLIDDINNCNNFIIVIDPHTSPENWRHIKYLIYKILKNRALTKKTKIGFLFSKWDLVNESYKDINSYVLDKYDYFLTDFNHEQTDITFFKFSFMSYFLNNERSSIRRILEWMIV